MCKGLLTGRPRREPGVIQWRGGLVSFFLLAPVAAGLMASILGSLRAWSWSRHHALQPRSRRQQGNAGERWPCPTPGCGTGAKARW